MIYILDGAAEYTFDNNSISVEKGNVIYIEKNKSYKLSSVSNIPLQYIVVSFNVENNPHIPLKTLPRLIHRGHILDYFSQIIEINTKKGIAHKLCVNSMIQLIIYNLLQDQLQENDFLKEIHPAINYIENHFSDKISISTLSSLTHMNISLFRKKFKSVTGLSPLKYVNQLRIEKAKEMLKSNLYTQTEIAEACGFNETSYFNKIFRQNTGCSPGKY